MKFKAGTRNNLFPVLQLSPDFRELRGVGASDLLYVKEDIILPHSHSFYDLIVNKVPAQDRQACFGRLSAGIWHGAAKPEPLVQICLHIPWP